MVHLAWDARTREYAAETIRCPKRYVAREVYRC
jgi:hypothetical protein